MIATFRVARLALPHDKVYPQYNCDETGYGYHETMGGVTWQSKNIFFKIFFTSSDTVPGTSICG